MSSSANNSIPFVPENTIDPAAGLNESINTIDALLQLAVLSVNSNTAPATPAEGDRHTVGPAPTGAWAGKAGKVARFLDGYWSFYTARLALNLASGILYTRTGAAWSAIQAESSIEVNGTAASALAFEGAGVTVTHNGDGTVTITIPGGGSGGGMTNPMTAPNQMIIGGTAGAPLALAAPSTAGFVLTYLAGSIQWAAGLLNPMTAKGDLIMGGDLGVATRLAAGTNGYVLTMVGGVPVWAAASGGGGAATWGTIGGNITDQPDLMDALDEKIDVSRIGIANGVPSLDAAGKVPASQLPSMAGPASTDDLSEGSSNLYFTAARVRAVVLSGLSVASNAAITATDTVLTGLGKLQAQITALGTAVADKLSLSGGTLTGAINNAPAVTLASATTVNIGAAAANTINIAGTITITGFGTIAAGAQRTLIFGGALTLTHSATKLILPSAANIVTAAGDVAVFESLGSGNWKCVGYERANGRALVSDASTIDAWASQPIGALIALEDNLTGVTAPPTDQSYRYIKLTASDSYNTGVLTSESVSGTAPDIIATATISLAGSPMNGQSVYLINTMRRVPKAGQAGALEADQLGPMMYVNSTSTGTTNVYTGNVANAGAVLPRIVSAAQAAAVDAATNGTRWVTNTGTETRVKTIGATYYMRIK